MKVHFICRGNLLRSIITEEYLKSLKLPDLAIASSGTNVDREDPQEHAYFENTRKLLAKHGLGSDMKAKPDQLTQERLNSFDDIVVCMNSRVLDEAKAIVNLPPSTIEWNITDIGEGDRTIKDSEADYEEEIYQEIKNKVDELVKNGM